MGTYKIKRHVIITATGSFCLLSLVALFLLIQRKSYADAMIALASLGYTVTMGLGLTKAIIMTTDGGIKRTVFGKPSQEYKWIWIYDIRTIRSTVTGHYMTTLSWAKELQFRGTGRLFGSN